MGDRSRSVSIQLLDEFAVTVGRRRADVPAHHRRACELVKLLALAPLYRMNREDVVEALWPHLDADAAFANLHKAASYARSWLGAKDAIVLRGGWVQLWPGARVCTDVERFERAAAQALGTGDPRQCAAVAEGYGAGLLPEDRYAEWTAEARERLRRRYLDLLRCAGRWAELVTEEPTDEHAHCELIRGLIRSDRRHAAIQQWQRLRDALAEVGLEPGGEALAVWRVLVDAPAAASATQAYRDPPLVGRESELAAAHRLLARVAAGQGGTLLICGDPGTGKSRFAEAVLAQAAELGWVELRASASRAEGAGPWTPVVEAFDRILNQRPELVDALSEPAREGLRRLFGRATPSPTRAEVRGRQPILLAASRLLEAAASNGGAVWWIDDLHAADEATVQLVHYVARTTRDSPVLLVLGYETGALSAAATELRASLLAHHGAAEVELGPLDPQSAAAVVRAVAGAAPPDEAVARVYRLAEGNPFFTEEIAASMGPDGSFAVPRRLREIVRARLDALEPGMRAVLQRVSVAGVQFTADEFAAFVDLDHAELSDTLDAALRARVLVESGGGYRFRHALVRETLQASLAEHHRRAAHRRAAEVLLAAGAAPGRVGHHLLGAGEDDEAVPYLERAAFEAAAAGAVADAQVLVERALQLAPRRSALLELKANCLFAAGAHSCLPAFADAIEVARGHRRRRLRIRLARAAVVLGDVTTATHALDGLVPATASERVEHLVAEGYVAMARSDVSRAERCAEQARRVALDEGLATELTGAATLRALVAHSRGDWQHQIEIDLMDTSKVPQLAASVHDGHLCVVEHYLYGSRPYAEIIAFAHRLRDAARRNGAGRGSAFATLVLGEAELLSGRHDAAERHLREAAELHRRVGSAAGQSLALQRSAEVALAIGRPAEARSLLVQALELARQSTLLGRHLLHRIFGTMIDAACGPANALAAVDEAESAVTPAEACRMCSVTFLLPAARACARAGELARAREYLAAAREIVQPTWHGGTWPAALAAAEAAVNTAARRPQDAAASWQRAADLFAAAGQPHEARRCAGLSAALLHADTRDQHHSLI